MVSHKPIFIVYKSLSNDLPLRCLIKFESQHVLEIKRNNIELEQLREAVSRLGHCVFSNDIISLEYTLKNVLNKNRCQDQVHTMMITNYSLALHLRQIVVCNKSRKISG